MAPDYDPEKSVQARWVDRSPNGPRFWTLKIPSSYWTIVKTFLRPNAQDHELMGAAVRIWGHEALAGMGLVRLPDETRRSPPEPAPESPEPGAMAAAILTSKPSTGRPGPLLVVPAARGQS